MANAIVLEVLEFVRPIRLQVERVSLADAISDAISLAEGHVPRGEVRVDADAPEPICRRSRGIRTSCGSSSPTC